MSSAAGSDAAQGCLASAGSCLAASAEMPAFDGHDINAIYSKIKIGKFEFKSKHWDKISFVAKDLITKMI